MKMEMPMKEMKHEHMDHSKMDMGDHSMHMKMGGDEDKMPMKTSKMDMGDHSMHMKMGEGEMKGMPMPMVMYMMPMHFWQGNQNPNLTFLFRTWTTTNFGTYFLGMLFTIVVAMSVEGFNYALKVLHKKALTPQGISVP